MLLLISCSARVEKEPEEQTALTVAETAPKQEAAITIAAIETQSEEAYFDLIAETSGCLGENLWIGGKIARTDNAAPGNTGATTKGNAYKLTNLTATGLSSNSTYTLSNNEGTLKAVGDDNGTLYIQLSEGALQLVSPDGNQPVVVAFQTSPEDGYYNGKPGSWHCQ
ncbi:hypothetical protein [Pontibacter ruber]|uniref:Uncharacterized protein n=1 Tax=Pontibacter ruber TaxID=1343895 RepID=A0ABW5CY04_9BACT|nr:hypothetical protein [Pontibacter ruber]